MAYRIEVGPKADGQLRELDPAVGSAVERKIIWLSENAAVMIHRRLAHFTCHSAQSCAVLEAFAFQPKDVRSSLPNAANL